MNPFDAHAAEFHDVWYHAAHGPALGGLTFTLARGEAMCLAGSPDAGASLVIDLLLGSRRPARGSVRVLGRDPAERRPAIAYQVGVVRRPDGLEDQLSAKQNLLRQADLYRLMLAPKTIADLWARVGLGGRTGERAGSFGLLDRRRLALARALAHDPALLVLERFFDGLAAGERAELEDLVADLARSGKAILVTSRAARSSALLATSLALPVRA